MVAKSPTHLVIIHDWPLEIDGDVVNQIIIAAVPLATHVAHVAAGAIDRRRILNNNL